MAKRKNTNKQYAVRLTGESERALEWLRKRPGGFNLSRFVQQEILEYAGLTQTLEGVVKRREEKV